MKLSSTLRGDISKVGVITAAFMMISMFFTFYNEALFLSDYSLGTTELYDFSFALWMNAFSGLVAGILGGSTLVVVNRRIFRRKSYGYALRATFVAYSLAYLGVTVVMSITAALAYVGLDSGIKEFWEHAIMYITSEMALVYYVFWGSISFATLFFLQMVDKFGPSMFGKFLAGKYNQPREEDRIFMFLDLKSSTTIAERIGNTDYFLLLQEIFTDLTDPILAYEGEIYQYVGDEIVISWDLRKGIRNANCFRCFLGIQKKLEGVADRYLEKYGVKPQFKAGLHYGKVTAGEIGTIKRDIVYSGDVLNTTSRIQEQCNQYDVNLIVSSETLELLKDPLPYEVVPLGNIELRGKTRGVDLNTLKLEEN